MPLPNFPQMSLFSNGNSVLWDISWESSHFAFRPDQADLIIVKDEITGVSEVREMGAETTREADRPPLACLCP
jgi:hypothetical protein